MTDNLDDFTLAFLEAALWSSIDDGGEPLDNEHSIADIDPGSLARQASPDRIPARSCWKRRGDHGLG